LSINSQQVFEVDLLFLCMRENPVKFCLGILLAITGVLPGSFAAPVAGPGANEMFLFASPNARESLTDENAKALLTSLEQVNATAVADRAACALSHSVRIGDSLGIYDKSSENSFILEADLEQKQSEYLAALLGLYSRQEFILLFLEEARGNDGLWIIETPQSLDVVIPLLRKWKLTPVTVRTDKNQTEIWFSDFGRKRTGTLNSFTSDVNGNANVIAGVAEMLGDQDRSAAVKLWRRQIRAFEQKSGHHLSMQLSSVSWRRATEVHTCSREISIP
jgi:hypothetical protein